MRGAIFAVLATVVLGIVLDAEPSEAESGRYYEVVGVESDDLLKLRDGPGTEFNVIVGLPNGAVLRVHNCEQIGSEAWCKVSLKQVRGLKGYVSWQYLQKF